MKVITVSRFFPGNHPKKGFPTFFIERIKSSVTKTHDPEILEFTPKHHTIRKGNRWQKGEMASLKYWSGRPYHTTPIEFLQVEVVEIKKISIFKNSFNDIVYYVNDVFLNDDQVEALAKNDGLSIDEMNRWFFPKKSDGVDIFHGQIICWTPVNQY